MSQGIKRKRQQTALKSRKRSSPTNDAKPVQRSSAVRAEKLKWKSVTVSKQLDDAEGFYGLEELSDVEVVRDDSSKNILFEAPVAEVSQALSDEDEWSGFDEKVDPVEDHGTESNEAGTGMADGSNGHEVHRRSVLEVDGLEDTTFSLLEDNAPEPEIDMSAWTSLNLSQAMLYALSALKFPSPTNIQRSAIPSITAGRDVIGKAVTGSGKTLAFGIPIIDRWLDIRTLDDSVPEQVMITALILAPTRELAHQISKHITDVCKGLDTAPRVTTVTGGLSIFKQQRQLANADIVVGTPGRLWEVISESNDLLEKFRGIRYLVIDEADRLLSEGHFKELEQILDALDRETINDEHKEDQQEFDRPVRQTLVFSATFHKGLQQKLSAKKTRKVQDAELSSNKQSMDYLISKLNFQEHAKPVFVDANPETQMAENLSETILECKAAEKDLYLYGFLLSTQNQRNKALLSNKQPKPVLGPDRILVFTNSISAVKRVVSLLQSLEMPNTTVAPLHSNMPQKSRLRSLERFSGVADTSSKQASTILVATDVAARGLDIQGITTIVHYHVPRTADTYVHRSGRTARVDASGSSILLCSPDEIANVSNLIAKVHGKAQMTAKAMDKVIERLYLPNDLLRQIGRRIELAQNLVETTQSTDKVKHEENWLKNAAEELGVEYDSDDFEQASRQVRRGRGGDKERKQKKVAKDESNRARSNQWKAQLREELSQRIDFGDGAGKSSRYLAGGAFDVDQMLAERMQR